MDNSTPTNTGDNMEACLEADLAKFRAMMEFGIKQHPQFETEYPRLWEFRYGILGLNLNTDEEHEENYSLVLHADDTQVVLWSSDSSDDIEVELKPYPPEAS